jgi:hypothetical protein
MSMSRHQTTGQCSYMEVANKPFENVAKYKYTHVATTATNQNRIHEIIKSRPNSDNACYMQFRIFCLPVCNLKS